MRGSSLVRIMKLLDSLPSTGDMFLRSMVCAPSPERLKSRSVITEASVLPERRA